MIYLTRLQRVPERFDMKEKGSMTVFAAVTFMLVASFLFALLEASRISILMQYMDMTSEMALESVCAEYQPLLWEEYHLLCLDGAYGGTVFSEEYISSVLAERIRSNLDIQEDGKRIMEVSLCSAVPENYRLLTDQDGQVFLQCIARYMQKSLPMEAAQLIYARYEDGQKIQKENAVGNSIENAKQAVETVREEQKKSKKARAESRIENQENPLSEVLTWRQKMTLATVLPNLENLSTQAIEEADCIQNRTLQQGTWEEEAEVGWYERVLAMEYAEQYFSNYLCPQSNRALIYELEYLLGGKMTDRDNMQAVVERLLLVREAANVLHIISDAEKRAATLEMATALVGFTANPAIIKVVECGVIGAWAYVESVLDIRALLCGKAITLVKDNYQWTSSLSNLTQFLEGELQASDCEGGWNYQDYLKGLLYMMTERNLAYRMMDMMEQNLRHIYAYRNCRMEHMVSAINCKMQYEAEPLFWKLSVLDNVDLESFGHYSEHSFAYY